MAPTNPEKRSLKEIRAHKEERKKWREKNLIAKFEKRKLKEKVKGDEGAAAPPPKRLPTVSVAVPGSILENAQLAELRTYLAGQIARAACSFQIDEVVVFDDYGDEAGAGTATWEAEGGPRQTRRCCVQLGRVLQYLECPQYLRKSFFPIHGDLRFAGLLNPLDAPHHLRQDEDFEYREGVVTNKPVRPGRGSQVNVGLPQDAHIDKLLTPGIRCTVRLLPRDAGSKKTKGVVVSPTTPREQTGVYWGYNVRLANSLAQVFSQCPYKEGYDLTIGTSDKGTPVDDFEPAGYKHALIVFGGLHGLEAAVENDSVLHIDDPKLLFDHYLNTLPNQGSRTIRTEEAILITLTSLRAKLGLNSRGRSPNPEAQGGSDVKTVRDDMSRFD